MRLRNLGVGLAVGTAAIATALFVGPNAYASHGGGGGGGGGGGTRPCGQPVSTMGAGSLGTGWTLKSMYDDDGATPGVVVGEEFQINTEAAGQQWTIQLADNGLVFFNQTVTSTAAGITAMSKTPDQPPGDQIMTAHAVNIASGEVISASVDLPGPPPPQCGKG